MSHWKASLCPLVFTLALGWAASGAAQTQSATSFQMPVPVDFTGPTYINDSGTITGVFYDSNDYGTGFIRQNDGTITIFYATGSAFTNVAGINAAGTIVGDYYLNGATDPGPTAGFLLDSGGHYTSFTIPGAYNVTPAAINSSGVVVGLYQVLDEDGEFTTRSFIRSASGVITEFDSPSEPGTGVADFGPAAINDSGVVFGNFYDRNALLHGYIRDADGRISQFDVPGSTGTFITAVNNKGGIVGNTYTAGFIRDNAGKFIPLPSVYPVSINQEGDICGYIIDYTGSAPDGGPFTRYSDGKIATLPPSDYYLATTCAINSSRTVVGASGDYFLLQPVSTIDYSSGLSSASESVNLKGSASLNGSQLMLTNGSDSEASSAFYGYPVDVRSFTTDFTFLPSDAVADGLTFTIQNDDPSAVGFPGAGLGYQRIDKSVAIKFDFHNNLGEGSDSTGLYVNGASPTIPAIDLSHSGINLASGDPMKVHVTYDSASSSENLTLTITDDFTMNTWSKTFTVDIPGTVGATTAYVGFTASTGEKTSTLAVSSWTYQAATATP